MQSSTKQTGTVSFCVTSAKDSLNFSKMIQRTAQQRFAGFKIKLFLFYRFHGTWLNLGFHFLTSIAQIGLAVCFLKTFHWYYLLTIPVLPWFTDGLGHLTEGNFRQVVRESRENKATNAVNVNGWTNFVLRLVAFPYALYKKKATPTFRGGPAE